ncbi:MAG: DUF4340 domain-containing protein [Planctomycetota bacterium]
MNFKTTAILLALFLIVGAVWLFFPKDLPEPGMTEGPPPPTPEDKAVFDPAPDGNDIISIQIERSGRPRLVFERHPRVDDPAQLDVWQAAEPLSVPVQNWTVNSLATTFSNLRARIRINPEDEDAVRAVDVGLEPPVAVFTMIDPEGQEYVLEIGNKAAMSDDTYVRVAGEETIQVVSRDLSAQVKKSLNDYRDRKLCAITANDTVALEVRVASEAYRLTRGSANNWVIDEPDKAYALTDEVTALLGGFGQLRVQEFVDDHAAVALLRYGLDRPYLVATVTTETQQQLPPTTTATTQPVEPRYETVRQTYTIEVGQFADPKNETRYARLAGQEWVVSVKCTDVENLIPDMVKLRDPAITRIKANDATRLELTIAGQTATLENVDGLWQGTGELAALERPAVIELLEAFEDLRAIDYVTKPEGLSKYGLEQPRAVITVTAGGMVAPVSVHVGDITRSGRNAYVMCAGQPTVFVVSAAQARRLVVPPLSLRSRDIFNADVDSIQRITLARGPVRYELERQEREWAFITPANAPIDPESVRVLVNDLTRLRARRVAGKDDFASFGLDQPLVLVQFAVEESTVAPPESASQPASAPTTRASTHTLLVGRKENVAYCRFDDSPYIFELDETIYRVLTTELIDRRLFSFKADSVVGLTIIGPADSLELIRQDDDWKFAPDPFVRLRSKRVNELLDTLVGLRVDTYLEYHAADLEATGLLAAPISVNIRLKDGQLITLKLVQERLSDLPRLAGWVQQNRMFRLRPMDCEKLLTGLDYYLAPETGETPAAPGSEEH